MATQETYVAEAKAQIARLNAEITKLRAEADAAQSEGKAELHRQLDAAKAHRDTAEAELQRLQNASAEAWADFKEGFEKARHALADGIDTARSHYTKS